MRLLLNKPDKGVRPDLDRSCCQPHAHPVALTEDARWTIESAAADVTEEPIEAGLAIFFAKRDVPK